jgi:hypothetical protein
LKASVRFRCEGAVSLLPVLLVEEDAMDADEEEVLDIRHAARRMSMQMSDDQRLNVVCP